LVICPNCSNDTYERQISIPTIFVKNSNTLGALAEKNSKKFGKYGVEDRVKIEKKKRLPTYYGELPKGAEFVEKKSVERPFWRPELDTPDMSLTKLGELPNLVKNSDGTITTDKPIPPKVEKYIMTGKK